MTSSPDDAAATASKALHRLAGLSWYQDETVATTPSSRILFEAIRLLERMRYEQVSLHIMAGTIYYLKFQPKAGSAEVDEIGLIYLAVEADSVIALEIVCRSGPDAPWEVYGEQSFTMPDAADQSLAAATAKFGSGNTMMRPRRP